MPRADYHDGLLQLLMGEVLRLKIKVSALEGQTPDELADTIVEFMQRYLELFPEESRPMLHEVMAKHLADLPRSGGDT